MHVAYLTGVYIHQDEPWYLNILCVRVTCKVHKSRKPGDNCTQVTCHSSWKGGRYLQETIPLGFHQCQLIAEKKWENTGPNFVASSFRTLGWSSSVPKALEGFKPLRSLITPPLEITVLDFVLNLDRSHKNYIKYNDVWWYEGWSLINVLCLIFYFCCRILLKAPYLSIESWIFSR